MPLHKKISCQVLGEQMQKLVEDCQDKTGSEIKQLEQIKHYMGI